MKRGFTPTLTLASLRKVFQRKTMPKLVSGFTLIELIVSVGIFAVVMVIALGALLSISVAERKSETLKSVMNNLNFTLDSMSRFVRTGTDYHCGSPSSGDCASGAGYFSFTAAPGSFSACPASSLTCRVAYCLDGGVIKRQVINGTPDALCTSSNFLPITAPEVSITSLIFYLNGSRVGSADNTQPKVTITLAGSVQINSSASTTLNLQTSVTQRLYDQ
ncbi:type II secretion system protein [Acetobacteraceae bacterium]|nr:type II secretion system protein [Candidatus Parcubacteria bacterium]